MKKKQSGCLNFVCTCNDKAFTFTSKVTDLIFKTNNVYSLLYSLLYLDFTTTLLSLCQL